MWINNIKKINNLKNLLLLLMVSTWYFTGFFGTDAYIFFSVFWAFLVYKTNDFGVFIFSKKIIFYFFYVNLILSFFIFLTKFYTLQWNTWDLGIHENILYNISNGYFFSSALKIHSFADHFSPTSILLSLLKYVYAEIPVTAITKPLFFYGAFPVLIMAFKSKFEEKKINENILYLITGYYLIFYAPSVNSLYTEFQFDSLAPLLLALTVFFYENKKNILFYIFVVLIIGLKEHMGATICSLGVYLILYKKDYNNGGFLVAFSLVYTYFALFEIMPYYRGYNESHNFYFDPFFDLEKKFVYLIKLLAPYGFFHLVFPSTFFVIIPVISVNLVSNYSAMYSGVMHYDVSTSFFIYITFLQIILNWKKFEFKGVYAFLILVSIYSFPRSNFKKIYDEIPHLKNVEYLNFIDSVKGYSNDGEMLIQQNIYHYMNMEKSSPINEFYPEKCLFEGDDVYVSKSKRFPEYYPLNYKYILLIPESARSSNHTKIFMRCAEELSGDARFENLAKDDDIFFFRNNAYVSQ